MKHFLIAEALVLSLALIIASCSPTRVEEQSFDWMMPPTIRFVTPNFEYPCSVYSAGDSITVGSVLSYVITDPLIAGGNWIAQITTASGDTESVDIFNLYFSSGKVFTWSIAIGTRIHSRVSSETSSHNGVLDILAIFEPITITLQPYVYKPEFSGDPLILADSAVVIR